MPPTFRPSHASISDGRPYIRHTGQRGRRRILRLVAGLELSVGLHTGRDAAGLKAHAPVLGLGQGQQRVKIFGRHLPAVFDVEIQSLPLDTLVQPFARVGLWPGRRVAGLLGGGGEGRTPRARSQPDHPGRGGVGAGRVVRRGQGRLERDGRAVGAGRACGRDDLGAARGHRPFGPRTGPWRACRKSRKTLGWPCP